MPHKHVAQHGPVWLIATRFLSCQRCCAGPVGVEPGIQRRGMLVFLETLVPYLTERLQQRCADAATDFGASAPLRRQQIEASAAGAAWWRESSRALLIRVRRSCTTACDEIVCSGMVESPTLRGAGHPAAKHNDLCCAAARRRLVHGAECRSTVPLLYAYIWRCSTSTASTISGPSERQVTAFSQHAHDGWRRVGTGVSRQP